MGDPSKALIDSVFEDKAKEQRLRRRLRRSGLRLAKSRKVLSHGKYVVIDQITQKPFAQDMDAGMTLDGIEGWLDMMSEFGSFGR